MTRADTLRRLQAIVHLRAALAGGPETYHALELARRLLADDPDYLILYTEVDRLIHLPAGPGATEHEQRERWAASIRTLLENEARRTVLLEELKKPD